MTGLIEQISKKIGKNEEEVKKELNEIYADLKGKVYPDQKELNEDQKKQIKVMSVGRIRSLYRKQLASNAQTFENVIFIGATEARDIIARKRTKAIEEYNKNPEEAVNKEIVAKEGDKIIPLYWSPPEEAEKLPKFMKDRLGKPLPEQQIERYVSGVIEQNGKWVDLFFKVRGDNTQKPIPRFSVVKVNGLKTNASTDTLVKINDSGELNIEVQRKLSEKEAIELLTVALKSHNIQLNEIEKFVSEHQEFERFSISKVFVSEILPEITTSAGKPLQMITVEDESMGFLDNEENAVKPITCFVPIKEKINFPEGSMIYVIGQPGVSERGNTISVMGFYVPEYCRNTIPKKKDIQSEGKESIPKPKSQVPVPEEDWQG